MTREELAAAYLEILKAPPTGVNPERLMDRIERLLSFRAEEPPKVLGSTRITETGADVHYDNGTEQTLRRHVLEESLPAVVIPPESRAAQAARSPSAQDFDEVPTMPPAKGVSDAVLAILRASDSPLNNAEITLALHRHYPDVAAGYGVTAGSITSALRYLRHVRNVPGLTTMGKGRATRWLITLVGEVPLLELAS